MLIDYENPDEVATIKAICIGTLTANVGAIISLTLIAERPSKLEWALVFFAISVPLLISSMTALDRSVLALAARSPIPGWVKAAVSGATVAALASSNIGYILFLWYFSEKALLAYVISAVAGLGLLICALKKMKIK